MSGDTYGNTGENFCNLKSYMITVITTIFYSASA